MQLNLANGNAQSNLDNAKTYTMRELNQRTAQVVEEVNRSGRPALVTKHGRFVALIMPLEGAQIESLVLRSGAVAAEVEQRAVAPDPQHYSIEEMLAEED